MGHDANPLSRFRFLNVGFRLVGNNFDNSLTLFYKKRRCKNRRFSFMYLFNFYAYFLKKSS